MRKVWIRGDVAKRRGKSRRIIIEANHSPRKKQRVLLWTTGGNLTSFTACEMIDMKLYFIFSSDYLHQDLALYMVHSEYDGQFATSVRYLSKMYLL